MYSHGLTILAHANPDEQLLELVLAGRLTEAVEIAEGLLADKRRRRGTDAIAALAGLCGDLMLAQDRAEEAQACYVLATRVTPRHSRGQMRIVSRRGTGLMSLHQHRFGTAIACFRDIVDDDAATAAQQVEALCALAAAEYGLGHLDRSMNALVASTEIADETGSFELSMLVCLVRVDLLAQHEVRMLDGLRDHVFRQLAHAVMAPSPQHMSSLPALDSCLATYGGHKLVAQRVRQLRDTVLAGLGDVHAQAALRPHLSWLRRAGMFAAEREARIEIALVAIATRQTEIARDVLEPLAGRYAQPSPRRWNVELSYCLAKLSSMSGRADEALERYQRYAFEALLCVRNEATGAPGSDRGPTRVSTGPKDGVEMSLPAKYRRAYRYLLDHLGCAELSVREIAEHMNVTMRALQTAFKSHLGMTPAEVIQRCRVERIRADLMRADGPAMTIRDIAARWGIRNRSTLVAAYRRYFQETPAETLARRDCACEPA